MLAIQENPGLVLLIIGLVIGFAVFIGTLLYMWTNRSSIAIQRAARRGVVTALAVGLLGLLIWVVLRNEPLYPVGFIFISMLVMAPTFLIVFYFSLVQFPHSGSLQNEE
ncbi:MAG: hypothetical protein V2I25_15100 [Woeseiaceae bacterium]|jgi:cytochrome bd-type quinol oxidase subunit 2|nr:hypothetical protein [Woeseiaceae bacterium]